MVKLRKILGILSTAGVALLVILAVLLGGPRLLGFQVFTVLSGSMEPKYPVGSLIYVCRAEPAELGSGDVITFWLDGDTAATHRIVEVLPDGSFRTKGDANDTADASPVEPASIIGSPTLTIPCLGYLAAYIQSPPGSYAAISITAAALVLVFLPELLEDQEKKEKKGKYQKT